MLVLPNSVNITGHLDLNVELIVSSKFLLNTYLFRKRLTVNLTLNETSRLCLHASARDIESKTLARGLEIFNIALDNALLRQIDFISKFEGTTQGLDGSGS